MLDLYTAFKITNIQDTECVKLCSIPEPDLVPIILTGKQVRNTYDMRKIKVKRIRPWFSSGDYEGFIFDCTGIKSPYKNNRKKGNDEKFGSI